MNIEFKYSLGDVVRTQRGEEGKVVALSAAEGRTDPIFRTCRLMLEDGTQAWVPEHRIDRVVGWR